MKPNKLGIYVLLSLVGFWVYTAVYLNICFAINVQPSDWMCAAFAVVTVVELIAAAWLKSGATVGKKDVEFIAEVVGKVLNIEAPSMSSGSQGEKSEEEDEEESEDSDEGEADEPQVLD